MATLELLDANLISLDKKPQLHAVITMATPLFAADSFGDVWRRNVGCDKTVSFRILHDPVPLLRMPLTPFESVCPPTVLASHSFHHNYHSYTKRLKPILKRAPFKLPSQTCDLDPPWLLALVLADTLQ